MRAFVALALGLGALAAPALQEWRPVAHAPGIVDVQKLRDGTLVVSTRTGLFEIHGGNQQPFARSYTAAGGEPYFVVVPGFHSAAASCDWNADDVFVLDADDSPGLVRVPRGGDAVRVLDFPKGQFASGIAWDGVGRFGHRLLVTTTADKRSTLYAIDCNGRATVLRSGGPVVEGGMAVAPASFGRFGGRFIAPDETSGRIWAFDAQGRSTLVAKPAVRAGGDLGVESLGFATGAAAAYLADLGAPGSPTEGTDSLLVLDRRIPRGTLVAATEGGATTLAVTCTKKRCTVRKVADGPAVTHGEGHVIFAARPS